jgi:hypothetical protein
VLRWVCDKADVPVDFNQHNRLHPRAAFQAIRLRTAEQAIPMSLSKSTCDVPPAAPFLVVKEAQLGHGLIGPLQNLKYAYRADIRDRAALERNVREKCEALNRVRLSDGEFARMMGEIVTSDLLEARFPRNENGLKWALPAQQEGLGDE